jgi:hypothetical protein
MPRRIAEPFRTLDGADLIKLEARIQRRLVEDPKTGCWRWQGAISDGGYGLVRVAGQNRVVHRVMWILKNGPVPPATELDHTCHQRGACGRGVECPHRSCANPAHLRPVTHQENSTLDEGAAANNARKTHCVRQHPLSGPDSNVYHTPSGRRQCRPCKAVAKREREALISAGIVVDRRRRSDQQLRVDARSSSEAPGGGQP